MKKERLEKEFEKTKDGKFKCPYIDIYSHVTTYRHNLKNHIRAIRTAETAGLRLFFRPSFM